MRIKRNLDIVGIFNIRWKYKPVFTLKAINAFYCVQQYPGE